MLTIHSLEQEGGHDVLWWTGQDDHEEWMMKVISQDAVFRRDFFLNHMQDSSSKGWSNKKAVHLMQFRSHTSALNQVRNPTKKHDISPTFFGQEAINASKTLQHETWGLWDIHTVVHNAVFLHNLLPCKQKGHIGGKGMPNHKHINTQQCKTFQNSMR